jgi:hypothetical protein
MRQMLIVGLLTTVFGTAACGGRSASANTPSSNTDDRLTSATITFSSLEDGKDAKSAVNVQLVRNGNELAADATSSGSEFDDKTTAPPVAMAIRGPFTRQDASSGQLRLRLTPDGDDTWTFNVNLALRYADQTQQNYTWQSVRLDEKSADRTLVLTGALAP